MAVTAAAGRAHGDEDCVGALDALGKAGGEGQAPGGDIRSDEFGKAGLVDRHYAIVQAIDLRLVLVDADHVVAEIGETGARHQADIARTHHCDLHEFLSRLISSAIERIEKHDALHSLIDLNFRN